MKDDPNTLPAGDFLVGQYPLDESQCAGLSQSYGQLVTSGIGFNHPDLEDLDVAAWPTANGWTVSIVHSDADGSTVALVAVDIAIAKDALFKFAALFLASVKHRRKCGTKDTVDDHIRAGIRMLLPDKIKILESVRQKPCHPLMRDPNLN